MTPVEEVYKRLGMNFPDINRYLENVNPEDREQVDRAIHGEQDLFEQIERPENFCIVTFSIRPPYTSHIGVVVENAYFIHSLKKVGVVKERLDSLFWNKRITGYWRVRA